MEDSKNIENLNDENLEQVSTATDEPIEATEADEVVEVKDVDSRKLSDKYAKLMGEGGKPMFCKETLPIREEKGDFGGTAFGAAVKNFYDMLYESVMNGAPLAITPEMAAEVIRVIEICHAQKPLPVKY